MPDLCILNDHDPKAFFPCPDIKVRFLEIEVIDCLKISYHFENSTLYKG